MGAEAEHVKSTWSGILVSTLLISSVAQLAGQAPRIAAQGELHETQVNVIEEQRGDVEWVLDPAPDASRVDPTLTPDMSLNSVSSSIPGANWPWCGTFDDKFKFMKDYTRLRVSTKLNGTYARLYCGLAQNEGTTSAFEYRHIKLKSTDWSNKSACINRHWHDLAAWSISHALRDPDRVTAQTNRFCYQRKFFLVDSSGEVVSTMIAQVALGETGVRIMTAFPRNSGGCSGDEIYRALR